MEIEREYWKKASEGISLDDYPEVDEKALTFPEEIFIAYAVSVKECGINEFIVDGSTQVCYYCGKVMFRTAVRRYVLAPEGDELQPDE